MVFISVLRAHLATENIEKNFYITFYTICSQRAVHLSLCLKWNIISFTQIKLSKHMCFISGLEQLKWPLKVATSQGRNMFNMPHSKQLFFFMLATFKTAVFN